MKLDQSVASLEQSMDLRLKRQALLASNLANIDTPNFKPKDLMFDGFLAESTEGKIAPDVSGEVVEKAEGVTGMDGNGVDLDAQVSRLTDNSIRYNTAMELMRRKLAIIRYAASEGRS